MSNTQPTYSWFPFALGAIALAVVVWPYVQNGCAPNGWTIGAGPFNVRVKPAPPEPVIVPPKTRCLIFGFATCPGCQQLHRTTRQMSRNGWRVGSEPADDIEHIDIYSRDERLSKYKHGPSYPDLLIVDQGGAELQRWRLNSIPDSQQLATWIQSTRQSKETP